MKVFKLQIFILLGIMCFELNAQRVLTYEGPFQNGLPSKSTARYTYYLDNMNQKVKQGSFRYLVKEKTPDSRLMHNFSGNYKNGLKDGPWEYVIKSKDYSGDNQGFYMSSDIYLSASYRNGVPDGKWVYNSTVSKRKKILINGKNQWTDYQLITSIFIQVNFKNGVIVDSLQIHDALGDTIDLLANNGGFLNGNLYFYNGKTKEINEYRNGFYISNQSSENEEFKYYMSMRGKGVDGFIVDTLSLLKNNHFPIMKYLDNHIFNKTIFLYEKIDGDACFVRNTRGVIMKTNLTGLFTLSLKPQLSAAQEKYIEDIWYYQSQVMDMQALTARKIKANPNEISLKNRAEALEIIKNEIQVYHCAANLCKSVVVPNQLYKVAGKNCGKLPSSFSKITTTNKWLSELLLVARSAFTKADNLSN